MSTRLVTGPFPVAPSLERVDDYFVGRFVAMACPCELLLDTDDWTLAGELLDIAALEAQRIERKFSRYRADNIIHRLNHSGGLPIRVDEETSCLIDYAATCHEASDGLFDITSGVLRRVWKFDGHEHVPDEPAIRDLLALVGWPKVTWQRPRITIPKGMEIDLGGIGKEYAVDRAAALVAARSEIGFLVNFGGDLFAGGFRRGDRPWGVGVDDPDHTGAGALYRVDLHRGGLATSGDSRRFMLWRGRRFGHILNPRTGWPVENAARSITVYAPTCLEAGTFSTLAYLHGPEAREFLERQGVQFRIV